MRDIFLIILLFSASNELFGQQADTTALLPTKDTTRYHLTLTATGSVNQTNSNNTYLLNQAIKLNANHRLFSVNAYSSYIYGISNNAKTNNDFFASLDGNYYLPHSRFFYWVLLNYTSSLSLKINSLFQGGAGAAFNFIKEKNNWLNISDGVLYEKDDLYIDTLHDIYNTYRNSLRVTFRWTVIKNVMIEGTNFIQNSFSNKDDYILKSNLALSLNLNKWLSITSTFVFNRINRTRQQNLLLNYGLRIEKDL